MIPYPDELRSDRRGACQIVADRGPDLLGKQKTPDLRTITLRMSWFYRNLQKVTPKGSLLDHFWVTFDNQDRPIMRQTWPSEPSLPRLRKTRRF